MEGALYLESAGTATRALPADVQRQVGLSAWCAAWRGRGDAEPVGAVFPHGKPGRDIARNVGLGGICGWPGDDECADDSFDGRGIPGERAPPSRPLSRHCLDRGNLQLRDRAHLPLWYFGQTACLELVPISGRESIQTPRSNLPRLQEYF